MFKIHCIAFILHIIYETPEYNNNVNLSVDGEEGKDTTDVCFIFIISAISLSASLY